MSSPANSMSPDSATTMYLCFFEARKSLTSLSMSITRTGPPLREGDGRRLSAYCTRSRCVFSSWRGAPPLGQFDQLASDFVAMNLDAGDQHRLAALVEHRGGFARRFFDLTRIGVVERQMAVPLDQVRRHLYLAVDHVAMNFDVP